MKSRLPFAVALVVFGPALLGAQAPNLQPAHVLPGTPLVGPAAGMQRMAALARGTDSTLLVFEDDRAGDGDIYGVRLDALGAPLDVLPFAITHAPGNQSAPKVCWSGQDWLVVYSSQVDPGSGYFAYEVAVQRVSPQGLVLDPAPIGLTVDDTGGGFAVASDGQGWAVLTTGYSGGNSALVARRIGADGTVVDPAGVVVDPGAFSIFFGLTAAFVQGRYVFGWTDGGTRVRRFDTALQALDPAPVLLSSENAALVSSGTQLLLAYTRQTPLFTSEVVARRFDANLVALEANPIAISGFAANVFHEGPAAAWDGTRWIVAWTTGGQQVGKAARLSAAGVVLDAGGVTIPEANGGVLYGWTPGALAGGGALLAWEEARYGSALDVYGTPLFASGTPGGERTYSKGAEAQRDPRVTPGAEQVLLTFRAELSNGSRVLAQRVDAFGNALDVEPLQVAQAAHAYLGACAAAWNGALYLVTWSDTLANRVYARRLSAQGVWLDAAPIEVLVGRAADVAALGDDFLVTGLNAPSYPQYVFSFGARVRGSDGAVLDAPALFLGETYATRARVVALGGRWLVATESHWSHDDNGASVLLTFVDANGVVTQSNGIGVFNIQDWGSIDLASAGSSALVVAQTGSNWTNTDVYAQRVLPSGVLDGPSRNLTAGTGRGQSRASVSWTGAEYLVAYQSYQSNAWSYDFEPDVYAVRVSEAGTPLDTHGFGLFDSEGFEQQADVGSPGDGRAESAVSSFVDGAYAAMRIALRGLRPAGLTNFGAGTSGCEGPQRMDANGEPFGGNAGFALRCDRAPASALGVLVSSTGADLAGSDPLGMGVLLHLALNPPHVVRSTTFTADAQGHALRSMPIPALPSLYGRTLYFQAGFPWSGPCSPSPSGFSTSDGLAVEIQAP